MCVNYIVIVFPLTAYSLGIVQQYSNINV